MALPVTIAGRQYDLWAHVYDRLWGGYARRTLAAISHRMDLSASERVLDVGCGTGILERMLADEYPALEIVGMDASDQMLRRAREKSVPHDRISFVHAKASELPFADGSFDAVISASVLHYLPDVDGALSEVRRVVRPGGSVYITDWARDFATTRLRDVVLRAADPAHHRAYGTSELKQLLEGAGLAFDRLETFRAGTYGMFFVAAVRPDGP